jgi:cation diffusion facilitator CzcD-associated flavoprotein CzcO
MLRRPGGVLLMPADAARPDRPHLAILGGGPTGLDAALEAAARGWSFTVYEAADRQAGNVRSWGHVRLFSPWSLDASPRMREALAANGGSPVPEDDETCPTGRELAESVLDRVAALPTLAGRIQLGTTVVAVGREGLLKHEEISSDARRDRRFRLLVRNGEPSSGGTERVEHADAVLDCTGSLAHPNTVGDGGIPAPGEASIEEAVVRRIPDVEAERSAWAGKRVLLVGGGHSAWTAARDLARLADEEEGTEIVWALRCRELDWRVPDDPLPARDRLAAEAEELAGGGARGGHPAVSARLGVVVERLAPSEDDRVAATLRSLEDGGSETVTVDRVLALTGAVGDHALYRQLQVHECYASGAPMQLAAALLGASGGGDCMAQEGLGAETLLNPEPRFFILGAKSYGRNSAYLMRIGWQQVDGAFGLLAESFG